MFGIVAHGVNFSISSDALWRQVSTTFEARYPTAPKLARRGLDNGGAE